MLLPIHGGLDAVELLESVARDFDMGREEYVGPSRLVQRRVVGFRKGDTVYPPSFLIHRPFHVQNQTLDVVYAVRHLSDFVQVQLVTILFAFGWVFAWARSVNLAMWFR